jgi:hypothetical protein
VPVDEETFLSASLKSNAPMGTPHQ